MKSKYKIAEDAFDEGKYIHAFEAFKDITQDVSITAEEKSDAFNMMGVIVLFAPEVENNDESGIEYFLKALQLNSKSIGALFNVIEGFGLSVNNHKNSVEFDNALRQLNQIGYEFTDAESKMIEKKIEIKASLAMS